MKLSEILRIVGQELDLTADGLFEDLVLLRHRDYWGDAEAGWLYEGDARKERLRGDMTFDDRFILFDYVGHYPMGLLYFPKTQAALEGMILADNGIFNPFTSAAYPFIDGVLRAYECSYVDEHGNERIFDKEKEEAVTDFGRKYTAPRLRWL